MLSEQTSLTKFANASSCTGSSDCGSRLSDTPNINRPAGSVCEGRKLVGKVVTAGSGDTAATKLNLLQLEVAVFAEPDLLPDPLCQDD